MINKNYIAPVKQISVYTGAHGAGKTFLFYQHEVHESWAELGYLPAFIGETQRTLSECYDLNHSDQEGNLKCNETILELLYTGMLKNEQILMDRCILDVLIYKHQLSLYVIYSCRVDDFLCIYKYYILVVHYYI